MFLHSNTRQNRFISYERGFGLVELMVTISIMMILSVIILVRNTSFNGALLLRNQAYEVAFALRQAQLLAVSGNTPGTVVNQQYGVYFNSTNNYNQTYFVFYDSNGNDGWDGQGGVDMQIGATGRLDSRFKVRDITKKDGSDLMTNSNSISVLFKRPDFDGIFMSGNGTPVVGPVYIDIAQVSSAADEMGTGDVRRVEITPAGQISVITY